MTALADNSARVAILHAIARRADELRHAIDPSQQPQTTCERVTQLAQGLGALASADPRCIEDYIVDMGADLLLWAEALESERRAG